MSDPLTQALWQNVLDAWDDPQAHERYLNHCVEAQQLPAAARQYRALQTADPGRQVQPYLQRIATLALSQIDAARTPPRVVWQNAASLLVAALILGLGLALLISVLD